MSDALETKARSGGAPQAIETSLCGEARRSFRVALVTMPFSPGWTPSIQVGLLKSIATQAGFSVDDYYPNVELVALLGIDLYNCVCMSLMTLQLTGDWLFSHAAFGEDVKGSAYADTFPEEISRIASTIGRDAAFLNDLRERVLPEFIETCLNGVDWGAYQAVGFTSAYQQHVASLALARRIKERFPSVTIVFGGANMHGDPGMEFMRAFPYIDYAASGEGDDVFPELLSRLAAGGCTGDLPGMMRRCGDGVSLPAQAPLVRDLNKLPTPDYSAYFQTVRRLGLHEDPSFLRSRIDVPLEASRGCWWGEKQHCVFCNHKDVTMPYRSKSADKVLDELAEMHAKYGTNSFWATDDILDMRMINDLFGRLAEEQRGYRFSFFNLKSNLTREQIRTLARGGVVSTQAGIESLNTRILKLMRKGCTKLQNLTTMKWSRYYGIWCGWNLLYGIPGERVEDYVDQLATLRRITHFNPPYRNMQVVHLRYAPLYMDDEAFPKRWRRPSPAYACIYPASVNPEQIACVFDCEMQDVLPEAAQDETREFIGAWLGLWDGSRPAPSLTYRRTGTDIVIDDTRAGANRQTSFTISDEDADIYEAFGNLPRTPAQACAALASASPSLQLDEETVAAACETFCDAGLMIGEGGKYLSLAIPADPEF
jgi:ribosomal peptide maturation radical SAM protein 1